MSKILDNSKEGCTFVSEIRNNTIRAGLAVNSGEKTMMTTYNTIWVEVRAVKGIATKAEQKEMGLISPYVGWKAAYRYYPSKEAAQKHIAEMASRDLARTTSAQYLQIVNLPMLSLWAMSSQSISHQSKSAKE